MSEVWVPESERDTRWYLFNKLFHCRVPWLASRDVEDIRRYGTPMSGDPLMDRQTNNELRDRMITIDAMVEYFKRGVQVEVTNESDTKQIYDYISAHLQAWAGVLEHSLNRGNAPIEDLILLDKFANTVYKHARWHLPKNIVESHMARGLRGVFGAMSKGAIFGNEHLNEEGQEKTPEEQLPERTSYGEIFANRRTLMGGRPTVRPMQTYEGGGSATPDTGPGSAGGMRKKWG